MVDAGKLPWTTLLAVALASQIGVPSQEKPREKPPAAERIPFSLLKPDAVIDLPGVREIAAGSDAIWLSSRETGTIARVDVAAGKIVQTIAVGHEPCGSMTTGFGSLWVALCSPPGLTRIDLKTNAISATIPTAVPATGGRLASAVGSLWSVADDRGTLMRLDPETNAAVAEIYTDRGGSLAFGADALWVVSPSANALLRLNPYNNVVTQRITVGRGPVSVTVSDGAAWTLDAAAASVSRVDAKTHTVAATIALERAAAGGQILSGSGSIWVTQPGAPLARIDPRTNRLAQVFTGDGGGAAVFSGGALWLLAGAGKVWRLDPRLVEATRAPR